MFGFHREQPVAPPSQSHLHGYRRYRRCNLCFQGFYFLAERVHVGVGADGIGASWIAPEQVRTLPDAGPSIIAGLAEGLGFVVAAGEALLGVVVDLQAWVFQQDLGVSLRSSRPSASKIPMTSADRLR